MNNLLSWRWWHQKIIRKTVTFSNQFFWLLLPYLIIASCLIFLPLLIIILYILLEKNGANGLLKFTLSRIDNFFKEKEIWIILGKSIFLALITISISLVLGYPIAYWMSLIANRQRKQFFYLIISLPIWINLLIRTIGLEIIFTWFDVSIGQTIFIGTNLGVVTAMVWLFLPIIILPIYQSLTSVDKILIEVSQDLGASPLKTFWKITFRHSIHGIAAGSILMLPMIMGALTVPKYIGKGKISWIGNLIETYFLQNEDFTLIAVASICLSLVLLIISLIIKKTAKQIWNAKGIKDDKKIF